MIRVMQLFANGETKDVTPAVCLQPQKTGNYRRVTKCICGCEIDNTISVYGPLRMRCCGADLYLEERER